MSLLREKSTKQAEQYLVLLEAYQKALPAAQAQKIAPAVTQVRSSVEELKKVRGKEDRLKSIEESLQGMKEITSQISR